MRIIWQSDGRRGRLLRLSLVIVSFFASFYVIAHALAFIGVGRADADGVAFIIALMTAAFVVYA